MCVCLYVNHDSNHAPYTTALIKLEAYESKHSVTLHIRASRLHLSAVVPFSPRVSMAPVLNVARLGEDRYAARMRRHGATTVFRRVEEREQRMHGFITERCSVSPVAAPYGGPLARRLIEIQTGAPLPHQSQFNFHIYFFILAKDVFQVCFRRGFRWSARWLFHLPLANHTLISPRTGRTEWNR